LNAAEPSGGGVTEPAPAKINLYLHVTGRRDDGYHLLDSLIVFTDFGDVISVAPADGLSLSVSGPFASKISDLGERNLVMRAAASMAAAAGVPPRAALTLEKRLPVAAGIGGGSADAAATLRALRRFWSLQIDDDTVRRLALGLGADVPACLRSTPVAVSGIGDVLAGFEGDWPRLHMVLANPRKPLATAGVFTSRSEGFGDAAPILETPANAETLISALTCRRNDLEEAARTLEPLVVEVLHALSDQPDCRLARMSGSGATCFGLFSDAPAAERAAREMVNRRPEWWVVATSTRAG